MTDTPSSVSESPSESESDDDLSGGLERRFRLKLRGNTKGVAPVVETDFDGTIPFDCDTTLSLSHKTSMYESPGPPGMFNRVSNGRTAEKELSALAKARIIKSDVAVKVERAADEVWPFLWPLSGTREKFLDIDDKRYVMVECDTCDGTGIVRCTRCGTGPGSTFSRGSGQITCRTCSGDGKVTETDTTRDSQTGETRTETRTVTCGTCGGDGDERCPSCGGDGTVSCSDCMGTGKRTRNYSVTINLDHLTKVHYRGPSDPDYLENRFHSYFQSIVEERIASVGATGFDGVTPEFSAKTAGDVDIAAATLIVGEHGTTVTAWGDTTVLRAKVPILDELHADLPAEIDRAPPDDAKSLRDATAGSTLARLALAVGIGALPRTRFDLLQPLLSPDFADRLAKAVRGRFATLGRAPRLQLWCCFIPLAGILALPYGSRVGSTNLALAYDRPPDLSPMLEVMAAALAYSLFWGFWFFLVFQYQRRLVAAELTPMRCKTVSGTLAPASAFLLGGMVFATVLAVSVPVGVEPTSWLASNKIDMVLEDPGFRPVMDFAERARRLFDPAP